MARTKKAFDGKRHELLMKIWDIFLRNGYENTTLALIMKELSIPKGVFYHYFRSKEDCADRSIEMFVNLCIDRMRGQDLPDMDAEKRLARLFLAGFHFFNDNLEQKGRINAPSNAVFHQKLMIAVTKQLAPVYSEAIVQGVAERRFDTGYPLEAAEMILTLSNFYLDGDLFQWGQEAMPGKIQALADSMERILGAEKGTFGFMCSMAGLEEK